MDTKRAIPSVAAHLRGSLRWAVPFLLVAAFIAGSAAAQDPPRWFVSPDGDYFVHAPGGVGYAYVEAFSMPAGVQQIDTGLFLTCDPTAADGFDLYLWSVPIPEAARDPFDGTVNVMTRRASDAVRNEPWQVASVSGRTLLRPDADLRSTLLGDLDAGGDLAVRIVLNPDGGADNPTFRFRVSEFERVRSGLTCTSAEDDGLPPGDPFSDDPDVDDPDVDVPDDGDVDPWEDALDPVTGLPTDFTWLDEYDHPEFTVLKVLNLDVRGSSVQLFAAPGQIAPSFGIYCDAEGGGGNGVRIEITSQHLQVDVDYADLMVFVDGEERGYAELSPFDVVDGATFAVVTWDEEELGLFAALRAFDRFETLVFGDDLYAAVDAFTIDAVQLREAMTGLACADAF